MLRLSTARIKTNQIPHVILQATSQFSFKFALPFSLMTHSSSEMFQLKHYMLWTKRAHQSKIFQTFECSNESSPNSSCYFSKHKVRVYSNFTSLFNVMKDSSSVFFQLKPYILWIKKAHQSEIFRLLSGWVKIHQILRVIFEIKSQFFFISITL